MVQIVIDLFALELLKETSRRIADPTWFVRRSLVTGFMMPSGRHPEYEQLPWCFHEAARRAEATGNHAERPAY